jgi:hypothetical protein
MRAAPVLRYGGSFRSVWSTVDMTDGQLTAPAEAPLTQAQIPGSFWDAMNLAEEKMRRAWIEGSSAFPDKPRTRRLLYDAIAQLEYAKGLMA